MKLSLDLIAKAFENDMFDQTKGENQGLILLVKENPEKKNAELGFFIQGSKASIGTALFSLMEQDKNMALMLISAVEMYKDRLNKTDIDSLLDKTIESLEGLRSKSGKSLRDILGKNPSKPRRYRR